MAEKPFEVCEDCGHAWEAHSEAQGCVQTRTTSVMLDGEETMATVTCKCEQGHGRTVEGEVGEDVTILAPAADASGGPNE